MVLNVLSRRKGLSRMKLKFDENGYVLLVSDNRIELFEDID